MICLQRKSYFSLYPSVNSYRDAKIATMRAGGDFPYLTKPDEIDRYIPPGTSNERVPASE